MNQDMTQNMGTVRYIRIIFIMLALFVGAVSESWALEEADIVIDPNISSSDGSITFKSIAVDGRTVSITVKPESGKYIINNYIKVQKLLNPTAVPTRSRAPQIADYLAVSGDIVVGPNSGTYTFTVPEGYHGAYVTAEFKDATGLIFVDSHTVLDEEHPIMDGTYILIENVAASVLAPLSSGTFTGILNGEFNGVFHKVTGVTKPLFATTDNAIIKNVMMTDVNIPDSYSGNTGAIAGEAKGNTRIYNCGILPKDVSSDCITYGYDEEEYEVTINGFKGNTVGGTGYVGSLVGKLTGDGTNFPRVVNCFSYANITSGSVGAGIVGYLENTVDNTVAITQANVANFGIVMNCMFYGDITGATKKYPVYGGVDDTDAMIKNDVDNGINPYNYFRKNATFDDGYTNIKDYKRSWPAEEKNLRRFEYYRSVLNSNRRLCTWWISGTDGTAPTDAAVKTVDIAKWVLDPSIAPYPILKPWGKYPSVINHNKTQVWNPGVTKTENQGNYSYTFNPHWVSRTNAAPYEGKKLGTLTVNINPGDHKASHVSAKSNVDFIVTDMDTLNYDYGYYKIQLPYYNEVFGNPNGANHAAKYAGNYTDYVVTGWEISGGSDAVGYNFADRNSYKGRIFAQGGYFYVPEGVGSITITAHWGKAVYLANRNYSIDNVKLTPGGQGGYKSEKAFAPAGTIAGTLDGIVSVNETNYQYTFHGQPVYKDWQDAIAAVETSTDNSNVYNQAVVLISNHQVKNGSESVAGSAGNWHPFTIMSADFDFDNEPDYCLELQFRHDVDRPGIQPVRFDFLPVVELGLAVRHDNLAYAIGIFVPQGHFEITETALMRTTQFEWDTNKSGSTGKTRMDNNSPVILNGGEFEQLSVRYGNGNRTSYFLLGGNLWFHRFAPGVHPNTGKDNNPTIRLCPVNVIGGDFPEFYLSGLYRPDKAPYSEQGNPFCYTNGGHFGIIAGAGYEKINGDVTFQIDHSVIGEFYGGGINGSKPVGGKIDVTINNSHVDKYCGGPKVGSMKYKDNGDTKYKTVTTHATGTTFGVYYGGGNGGNSYYRQLQNDGDVSASTIATWDGVYYFTNTSAPTKNFNPLVIYDDKNENDDDENKGYHAEYEFEVFNQSNGLKNEITKRGFIKWIQFGITDSGDVLNVLDDCTINTNFFGGGNLASVKGKVKSTLIDTSVKGSVFGAGYSASIPTFKVHDPSTVKYPKIDNSGTLTDGEIKHDDTEYEWTNDFADNVQGTTEAEKVAWMKAHPTYPKTENNVTKYYCYTWNSLDDLGEVNGDIELNINGKSFVEGWIFDKEGNITTQQTGGVFGGGDSSAVTGKTEVNINSDDTADGKTYNVYNVYGGGRGSTADVGGSAIVTLSGNTIVRGNVFGGGDAGEIGGSATVNIK